MDVCTCLGCDNKSTVFFLLSLHSILPLFSQARPQHRLVYIENVAANVYILTYFHTYTLCVCVCMCVCLRYKWWNLSRFYQQSQSANVDLTCNHIIKNKKKNNTKANKNANTNVLTMYFHRYKEIWKRGPKGLIILNTFRFVA